MPDEKKKKLPFLDHVNDYIDLAQSLVYEEAVSLGGIVDRIQDSGYSVDEWTTDVARFWGRVGRNWHRVAMLPYQRQIERQKVLPTLVFLVDDKGESSGPQVVDLPRPVRVGTTALATDLRPLGEGRAIPHDHVSVEEAAPETLKVTLTSLGRLREAGYVGHFTGILFESGSGQREALAIVHAILGVNEVEPRITRSIIPERPRS